VRRIATVIVALILIVHGLIHLMGFAVYVRHAHIEGLPYKTTLLHGRWDLGAGGIRVFGVLWLLPAIGFVAVALALLAGWEWWTTVVAGAAILSLALTALDWSSAFMGAVINIAILALVSFWPRMASWFS